MEKEIITFIQPILNDLGQFLFPNEFCIAINSVIFFLLLITLVVSRHTIKRYRKREKRALKEVQRKVDDKLSRLNAPVKFVNSEVVEQDESAKEQPNDTPADKLDERKREIPDLLIDIRKLKEGVKQKSIIYKRLETIEKLREYRVKISVDFLQQDALNSEASRLGTTLPGFSKNLAMILGLCGTFIGLAFMVTKISMLMPNPNALTFSISGLKSSIANMETVFQGIKTAFSTSIVGIITTIICIYLDFRIHRNQTAFFHKLERFTVEKLIPVTVPPVQSEHPLENIAIHLQDSFDNLEFIITQNKDTIESLSTIQGSFKTIVDEVRDITKREASRNFEGVLTLLNKTNESITGIVKQWPKIVEVVKGQGREAKSEINSLIEVMKRQQKIFSNEVNRIMRIKEKGLVVLVPSLSSLFNNKYIAATSAIAIIFLIILLVGC